MRTTYDAPYKGKCPICIRPMNDSTKKWVGLRDHRVVNDYLPNKLGGSDIDFVLHQAGWNTRDGIDRCLMVELKKEKSPYSLGQKLMYRYFRGMGVQVWLVQDDDLFEGGTVKVNRLDKLANQTEWVVYTRNEYCEAVHAWWKAGLKEQAA
jgi:hypothetical protein